MCITQNQKKKNSLFNPWQQPPGSKRQSRRRKRGSEKKVYPGEGKQAWDLAEPPWMPSWRWDMYVHTYFHALPWYNCHVNAATFLVKFPFPCSFPGRKPKRRRGNPGSPLSGPNLLVLEYILNTLCKYYPRVWDRKLANEASRQGSRVSPWP